jgi:hypothetical protein
MFPSALSATGWPTAGYSGMFSPNEDCGFRPRWLSRPDINANEYCQTVRPLQDGTLAVSLALWKPIRSMGASGDRARCLPRNPGKVNRRYSHQDCRRCIDLCHSGRPKACASSGVTFSCGYRYDARTLVLAGKALGHAHKSSTLPSLRAQQSNPGHAAPRSMARVHSEKWHTSHCTGLLRCARNDAAQCLKFSRASGLCIIRRHC